MAPFTVKDFHNSECVQKDCKDLFGTNKYFFRFMKVHREDVAVALENNASVTKCCECLVNPYRLGIDNNKSI